MSENIAYSEVKMGAERSFGWVFCGVFTVIAAYFYYKSGQLNYWLVGIAVAFCVVSILSPKLLKPLNVIWFKFGMLLGHIVAPLVMMMIFFLVVTPIGLLMRAFGKDPLRLKSLPAGKSYWIEREDNPDIPSSMKNQF